MSETEEADRYFDMAGEFGRRMQVAESALKDIWKIVHTPTKLTRHRAAQDHFQSDFDSIRKIIAGTRLPQVTEESR